MKITVTVVKNSKGEYNAKYEHSMSNEADRIKGLSSLEDVSKHVTELLETADRTGHIKVK